MNLEVVFALLVGLTVGIVFMNIPPALTELMGLYGASYTQISMLISALLWTHAAMQIPAGMIADRLGIRRALLLSLTCMGLGNVLPIIAPDLGWAIGGRMITGLGTGMGFLVNLKMLALCAPGGRAGAYQAFSGAFFSLGSILAYLLIPLIVRAGWQWVFLSPALLCLPLLILVPVLRLAPDTAARPSLSVREIVAMRSAWILGTYHALSYGSMLSLGNWVPSLLAEVSGARTATNLAWGGALVMLISGLSRLCGGFVLYRISPLAVVHVSVLVLCVLFAGLALIPASGVVLGLALLAAWFGSINFGALFHLASRAASAGQLGTLLGFVNFLANLGAVAFTLMFGWSKDALGAFAWGFAVLSGLSAVALAAGTRILSSPPANSNTRRAESPT
jgi:nitrate/nitrite transporter NarK